MIIDTKIGNYKWIENWIQIPRTPEGEKNGRTHGVVVSKSGKIIIFHQAIPSVLIYDESGNPISTWGDFPGAHGMSLIMENNTEYLLLTDEFSSQVVKTTLDGEIVMTLPRPENAAYDKGGKNYIPTWAAQNEETGEIWVSDGYGASLVHRFSPEGKHQMSIDGIEGAGRFLEPHGINFCRSAHGFELFITDRANHRIVVYDKNGKFLRSSMVAHSPCSFDFLDSLVVVPELFGSIKILDKESFRLIAEIGANDSIRPRPDGGWWPPIAPEGWPDLSGTKHVREGRFNSPHCAAFTSDGDIYVVEWIIGGRVTKLEKQ